MKRLVVGILSIVLSMSLYSQEKRDILPYLLQGDQLFDSLEYRSAATQYKHACILDSTSFDAWFNFGSSLYKLDKYILSSEAFNKAFFVTEDPIQQSECLYNIGNCFVKLEKLEKAYQVYKKALILNPNDDSIRYNFAYVKLKIDAQKDPNENPEDKKDDKDKKDKEKEKPSAFALEMMKKAEDLINSNNFTGAYELLQDASKKDESIQKFYAEFIQKLEKVAFLIYKQ